MLKELDTPGWKAVFENRDIRGRGIRREDVMAVFAIAVPDHETHRACELFCDGGYLGIFGIAGGRFLAIQTECNTAQGSYPWLCAVSKSYDILVETYFAITDRERLGLLTPADRADLDTMLPELHHDA